MKYVRLPALIVCLSMFGYWFSPGHSQWVDGLWLVAVCLWVLEIRQLAGRPLLGLHVERQHVWPILAVTALLAVVWLPFYDNWRWAYTGDSISWYEIGRAPAATHHLGQSLLSLNGVDGNFTYLHGIAFNSLMFVFKPTLFWHRVGKLLFSCFSLAAIYTFFTLTLNRWWATAIVVGTASNYVWLWFSYVSYGHIDSFIFYFLTLSLAVLIFREPDKIGLWMACGLLGGLSMFFTQTSWSAVAAVGLLLGIYALTTRRFLPFGIYVASFLLVASPIFLQFPYLIEMTTRQAKSIYDAKYLLRIFTETVTLAYQWGYFHIGVQGAFLRWPLGPLYLGGVALATVAVLPPLRRALRLPTVAPVMLALFLWDSVLMTLTNNGYGQPSTKRVYQLIPLQVFFAVLPFYFVSAWTARSKWLRMGMVGLVTAALAVYAVANLRLIQSPLKGVYGVNIFDGLIELRQRFPEQPVVVFSSRDFLIDLLTSPASFFNETYHIKDTVSLVRAFKPHVLEDECAGGKLVCYEPNFDSEKFDHMKASAHERLTPFEMLNTQEMSCFECTAVPDSQDEHTASAPQDG